MNSYKSPKLSFFRRKFLINREFQFWFIMCFVSVAIAVIVAVFLASEYFFWYFTEQGRAAGLMEGDIFFSFLDRQRLAMTQVLFVLSSFFFISLSMLGLLFSHRIAGPLYRLERHMRAVARGDIASPIRFRSKDFFKELSKAYNEQYDYLKYGLEPPSVTSKDDTPK